MATITRKRSIAPNVKRNTRYNTANNEHKVEHAPKQRKPKHVKHNLSTYLFTRPSFLEGLARILDFGNTLSEYVPSRTPEEADAKALAADWRIVGEDIANAESQFSRQLCSSSSL